MPSSEVMGKFKRKTLRSGSKHGPKVTKRPQAVAIMMSEKREEGKAGKSKRDKSRARYQRLAGKEI